MENTQTQRVKYLESNDLLLGLELGKAEAVLLKFNASKKMTVNEALEYRQCKRLIDNGTRLKQWTTERHDELLKLATEANITAMKTINQRIAAGSLGLIFDEVEVLYRDAFWEMIEASSSEKHITTNDFEVLIEKNISQIRIMLGHPKIVKVFSDVLREAMIARPVHSAEIVMNAIAVSQISQVEIFLPSSLENNDVVAMLNAFIKQPEPHLNYLDVIINWSSQFSYKIPGETVLAAKRKYDEVASKLFSAGNHFAYGVEVHFTHNQEACIFLKFDGLSPIFSYSVDWIETYHDPATLLSNFIHVFNFIDKHANLDMPAHKNDTRSLLSGLVVRSKADYATRIDFTISDMKARAIIKGYSEVLSGFDIRLEDTIAWFFNNYIEAEFGISGFFINMPSGGTTYLEKCKSLCSEIEKVLKTYTLYVEKGAIDPDLLSYRRFSSFDLVPSLLEKKYLRGIGDNISRASYHLFSNQSLLAYTEKHGGNYHNLFKLVLNENTQADDFSDWQQPDIQWLISYGALIEDLSTQYLSLTRKAQLLYRLWRDGVIACHFMGQGDLTIIESLVAERDAEYYSTLFSDDEADYMSFNYNNKKFGDARAIRNVYSHGSAIGNDPNDIVHQSNYEILLLLIISVLLKINDELCAYQQKSNIIELIDWPYMAIDLVSIPNEMMEGLDKFGINS